MAPTIIPDSVRHLLASQPIELPIFHPIALKLQRMLMDYDFSLNDISEVAVEDQSLASQILKVSNSPMYMGRTKVATIKEAVIRLGAQQVINLAVAVSQAGVHVSSNKTINRFMKTLWLHSHGAALGARWLSNSCGMKGVADETYLAALLHDIGKLYLLKSIEVLIQAGVISQDIDDALILQIFEEMHVEQGYSLMQHWNFPAMYCDVVRDHHLEKWDSVNKMLTVVRFVNLACHSMGLGLQHDPELILELTPEAEKLELSSQQITSLKAVLLESRDVEFDF